MESARRMKANRRIEGAACGWCERTLALGEDVAVCAACEAPHHAACWDREGGCTTGACENRPIARLKDEDPARPAVEPGRIRCPQCAEAIAADEQICPFCNAVTSPDGRYRGPRTNAPGAVASVVYGFIGLVFFGVILGLIALKKAKEAKAWIVADPRYGGEGLATAGIVLGVIDVVGWAVALVMRTVFA